VFLAVDSNMGKESGRATVKSEDGTRDTEKVVKGNSFFGKIFNRNKYAFFLQSFFCS
jgi:hypothetical protein